MKNKCFSFVKTDLTNNFIWASGISWNEFYNGIEAKPKNILLLAGYPEQASFCNELNLEYITDEQMSSFVDSEVYGYGDFYWVDFCDESVLSDVNNSELADLLFMRHKNKPMQSYKIVSLQNRYAYLCHDDDYYVKIYMDHVEDYKKVVEYKIRKELKGRKRTISPIPDDIMDRLYAEFENGIVLDFEQSGVESVRIYTKIDTDHIEGIHKILDHRRAGYIGVIHLWYDRKTKKWNIRD
jgi:hypothetical protein